MRRPIESCRLPARTAGVHRGTRGVQPDVHSLDQKLRGVHIVVLEERNVAPEARVFAKTVHLVDEMPTRLVRGMSLAGKYNLNGTPAVLEKMPEPFKIAEQERGAFVSRESPREADREGFRVQQGPSR